MPSDYYVAWWNLENLFDVEGSPRRTEKLERAIGKDTAGWTMALLDQKVSQLASVLAAMNKGLGPDFMGVCEVENDFVLGKLAAALRGRLPTRTYSIAHADTSDQRGIDVAFLFDANFFERPHGETFQHVVMRRTATREILQVNFKTHRGRTWTVFGNHWPARSGGALETAGYRAIAGETLAYFHERALEVHGDTTPVLVMGDFNDEPFDASLVRHALSTRQRLRVVEAKTFRLWNLAWKAAGEAKGTFYYDNLPHVLDQFLVNRNMAEPSSALQVLANTVEVVSRGMIAPGRYRTPLAFGGMGKPVNQNGFSDHFPLGVRVREAD